MNKNNCSKSKPLNLEETIKLLGAERPMEMEHGRLDPMSMMVLATRMSARLSRKRGRPTDESWDMTRKIPMKHETWESIQQLIGDLPGPGRPAAGQVAAMALEEGLKILMRDCRSIIQNTMTPTEQAAAVEPEFIDEAIALCNAASGGSW